MSVILLFALSCVFAEEDKVGDFEIPLGLDLHGIVYFACFVISLIIIAPIAMLIQAIVDCFCGSRSCCYPCICPGQSDECCLGNNDDYISKPW